MENTAQGGMSRDSYSTRRSRVLYDSLDTHPRAVFFIHTSISGASLYFLVVWSGRFFVVVESLHISVIRISVSV